MTRARTKVGEWWEVEYSPGFRNANMFRRGSGRKKAHEIAREVGGKVYHVTRYQLAPLVKLVWREKPCELVAFNDAGEPIACVSFCTWRTHLEVVEAETPQAAKAACAARLLELGYRVVDEKGGAR